jgi:hypothetical protein
MKDRHGKGVPKQDNESGANAGLRHLVNHAGDGAAFLEHCCRTIIDTYFVQKMVSVIMRHSTQAWADCRRPKSSIAVSSYRAFTIAYIVEVGHHHAVPTYMSKPLPCSLPFSSIRAYRITIVPESAARLTYRILVRTRWSTAMVNTMPAVKRVAKPAS